MNEQTPAQANPETTTPNTTGIPQIPNVPDPVMQEVSKVTDALAKRIAGEPAKQVDWAGVAQFGMKTAIIVGGVAAATAAVVLITRAGSDGPIELPATPSV